MALDLGTGKLVTEATDPNAGRVGSDSILSGGGFGGGMMSDDSEGAAPVVVKKSWLPLFAVIVGAAVLINKPFKK